MGRVFILYKNSLFACGLETLLRQKGLDVVGKGLYERKTVRKIKMLKLDFIIAEVDKEEFEAKAMMSEILQDQRSTKVVQVSLEDNTIKLYTGKRWTANTPEELLSGIVSSTTGIMKRSRRMAHG